MGSFGTGLTILMLGVLGVHSPSEAAPAPVSAFLAAAGASSADSADQECPAPNYSNQYLGAGMATQVYDFVKRTYVTNLSKKTCAAMEYGQVAARGLCVSQGVCHAICVGPDCEQLSRPALPNTQLERPALPDGSLFRPTLPNDVLSRPSLSELPGSQGGALNQAFNAAQFTDQSGSTNQSQWSQNFDPNALQLNSLANTGNSLESSLTSSPTSNSFPPQPSADYQAQGASYVNSDGTGVTSQGSARSLGSMPGNGAQESDPGIYNPAPVANQVPLGFDHTSAPQANPMPSNNTFSPPGASNLVPQTPAPGLGHASQDGFVQGMENSWSSFWQRFHF